MDSSLSTSSPSTEKPNNPANTDIGRAEDTAFVWTMMLFQISHKSLKGVFATPDCSSVDFYTKWKAESWLDPRAKDSVSAQAGTFKKQPLVVRSVVSLAQYSTYATTKLIMAKYIVAHKAFHLALCLGALVAGIISGVVLEPIKIGTLFVLSHAADFLKKLWKKISPKSNKKSSPGMQKIKSVWSKVAQKLSFSSAFGGKKAATAPGAAPAANSSWVQSVPGLGSLSAFGNKFGSIFSSKKKTAPNP